MDDDIKGRLFILCIIFGELRERDRAGTFPVLTFTIYNETKIYKTASHFMLKYYYFKRCQTKLKRLKMFESVYAHCTGFALGAGIARVKSGSMIFMSK